jgi:hypothetical protein
MSAMLVLLDRPALMFLFCSHEVKVHSEPDSGWKGIGWKDMGGRSRDRIFGDKLRAAKIRLESAKSQSRVVDSRIAAAECELWSAQMEGYGGPAQPSPTIAQAVGAGYFYLEVKCHRCNHHGAIDLRLLRRHERTEIWRLEASLSCEECRAGHRWKAKVHMIKLSRLPDTSTPWYAPDETDGH